MCQPLVIARIRRMREGNIFTLCVSPHLVGRVPHPADREGVTPFPAPGMGGVPHPRSSGGYPPAQVRMGGTLSQV